MLIDEREKLGAILRTTAETLDIPDDVYEDATLKYEDIGVHLSAEDSDLRQYDPQIYPQGSFRLGTVIQPLDGSLGYDIDLVCRLSIAKESITQKDLKDRVGRRLRQREDLANILSPSRRCWVSIIHRKATLRDFIWMYYQRFPMSKRHPMASF